MRRLRCECRADRDVGCRVQRRHGWRQEQRDDLRRAVGRGIPRHDQRDIRTAIVAFAVTVGIYMVGVLFTACLTNGTGFRALVLGIAYA